MATLRDIQPESGKCFAVGTQPALFRRFHSICSNKPALLHADQRGCYRQMSIWHGKSVHCNACKHFWSRLPQLLQSTARFNGNLWSTYCSTAPRTNGRPRIHTKLANRFADPDTDNRVYQATVGGASGQAATKVPFIYPTNGQRPSWTDIGQYPPALVTTASPTDQVVTLINFQLPQTHTLSYYNLASGVLVTTIRTKSFAFHESFDEQWHSNPDGQQLDYRPSDYFDSVYLAFRRGTEGTLGRLEIRH